MGLLDSLRGDGQPDNGGAPVAHAVPGLDDGAASLRRRRDELVAEVAELHWDLGGLAYEMAIRDHFRLDVLVRKASELQHRDAELGELERVLSLQDNAGSGQCANCGAVRSRGAVYCWQCGHALIEQPSSATTNGDAATVVERPVRAAGDGEPVALAADEATSIST